MAKQLLRPQFSNNSADTMFRALLDGFSYTRSTRLEVMTKEDVFCLRGSFRFEQRYLSLTGVGSCPLQDGSG